MSQQRKFVGLGDAILGMIRDKGLRDGDKLPSEKELAKAFRVNHLTVRKALKLLESRRAIFTLPSKGNFVGKPVGLERGSGLIGVLFPEEETFYYEILSRLESRMALAGYSPVVHVSRWSPERERQVLEKFVRLKVEGIIAVPNIDCAALYRKLDIPVVFFDTYITGDVFPYVITGDREGGIAAVEHLVALGHRRIAYVGSIHEKTSESRRAAYGEVLARHGIREKPSYCLEKEYSHEWGYNAASQLFTASAGNAPSAVFCGNDAIASGVLSYLGLRRIQVPGEVSVMGFGNVGYSEYIGLSTVDQPRDRITHMVWKNMRTLLARQPVSGGTVIPTSLIVRKTTAAAHVRTK